MMVFHWSLSVKSPQVSRIILSILADLRNAVVLMVPTRPLISKSSCPYIHPFLTVPKTPITIGITVAGGACGVMVIVVGNGRSELEFKSWTRLIAFHIALIPLGKVWIQLFSLQLWVNSRADWVLQPWLGN